MADQITVSSTANPYQAGVYSAGSNSKNTMDVNSFIKLLAAQLSNQDMTSPMDTINKISVGIRKISISVDFELANSGIIKVRFLHIRCCNRCCTLWKCNKEAFPVYTCIKPTYIGWCRSTHICTDGSHHGTISILGCIYTTGILASLCGGGGSLVHCLFKAVTLGLKTKCIYVCNIVADDVQFVLMRPKT